METEIYSKVVELFKKTHGYIVCMGKYGVTARYCNWMGVNVIVLKTLVIFKIALI
jgi:hypothetical protein